MKKDLSQLIIQFIKFGIVGVSNTLISLIIYYIVIWVGGHYMIGNLAGFVAGVLNSFFWNNRYVFKKKQEKSSVKAFVKMTCAYGVTLVLSSVLMYLFVDIMHISAYLAPLICLVFTVPINFVMNKLWVFKDRNKLRKANDPEGPDEQKNEVEQ